jgi:hypothetical protein
MTQQIGNRDALRAAWSKEMTAAKDAADPKVAWQHLERAHILSQPLAREHVRAHRAMLVAAVHRRDTKEILGQVFRFVVAGPGSMTGRYPVGNTGGADVSAFAPMSVPDDLRELLEPATSHSPQ